MQISITGNKLDIGESLTAHIEGALEVIVSKYFGSAIDGTVVLSREGPQFRADITVHIGRGIQVRSRDTADDAYAAFDVAAAHLAKRLRRYKRRLRDHHKARADVPVETGAGAGDAGLDYTIAAPTTADDDDRPHENNPMVIAEDALAIEQLSVSEAVMRMDLADLPAMVFHSARDGALNVVYRRGDGNIGWVDPTAGERKS